MFARAVDALDTELAEMSNIDTDNMDELDQETSPSSSPSTEKERFILNAKTFILQMHRSMYKHWREDADNDDQCADAVE